MIYESAEDSFLIKKYIKEYSKNKKVLDLGTGSGILALEALKYTEEVTASDINEECLNKLKNKNLKLMHSDLFNNIKEKYDLIIFNPPYLPQDKMEDKESSLATTGGKEGYEIIERFLREAENHLNENGKILLLFSSLTNKRKVDQLIEENKFKSKLLESMKLDFEELFCYLLF